MAQLRTYREFLGRVDELGFLMFSPVLPGLPSLPEETSMDNWFTDDPDTDPWFWKYRAPEEKKLAFGNIIGGQKGFVAARMYAVFYAAFHPPVSMTEKWASGLVSPTVWRLWRLFEGKTLLSTSDIRYELGVSLKKGGSRVDAAIKDLQRDYYITVAGSKLKTGKSGKAYGWYENIYEKVTGWVPPGWLPAKPAIGRESARERILDAGVAVSSQIDRARLARKLRLDKE